MTIPFSFPTRYIRTHCITGGNSGEFNQCSLWNPTQSNFCCASIRQAPQSSRMHARGAPSADGVCKACVLQHITADSSKERLRINWGESEVVLGKVARAGQKYCSDDAGLLVSPPSSWCWSAEMLVILYVPNDALRRGPCVYWPASWGGRLPLREPKGQSEPLQPCNGCDCPPGPQRHFPSRSSWPKIKHLGRSVRSVPHTTCQTVLQNVGFCWILLGVETLVTVEQKQKSLNSVCANLCWRHPFYMRRSHPPRFVSR